MSSITSLRLWSIYKIFRMKLLERGTIFSALALNTIMTDGWSWWTVKKRSSDFAVTLLSTSNPKVFFLILGIKRENFLFYFKIKLNFENLEYILFKTTDAFFGPKTTEGRRRFWSKIAVCGRHFLVQNTSR